MIRHGYYIAHPWYLAGPFAAVAWGCAAAFYLRRRRPAWPLVVLDISFYAALAVSSGMCVPPGMRGVAGNWFFVAMASQVIVTVWFAPRVLAVPLGLAPEVAYWAGAVVTPPSRAQGNAPVVSGALLLVVLAIHWTGRGMLYCRASRADAGFAAADQEAHDQYVARSRNIERREHERLLHDTVLNTLTAISRGSSGAAVVARCGHDIALLEQELAAPADTSDGPAPGASLEAEVEAVAAEMRSRGLAVHVAVTGRDPGVPVAVARAVAHATREALANVAAHAGTGEAWVTIILGTATPGAATLGMGEGGGLRVTVRDAGAGFDPVHVDPAGWDCAARSPSGSPTGVAACLCGRHRARAPW